MSEVKKEMDIPTIAASFAGVLTAVGGWEFVKWMLNRKSNSRIAEANAESMELKNEKDEFHFLRERLEYKDEALKDQTELVRMLNKQLLDQTIENGKLQARISALEAERAMKLCEKRGCMQRQPQSGY